MIRINLLPLAARQSKWPVTKLLFSAGLLVIMIFSCLYSYSVFEVWNTEKQLQVTRNQYQALQPISVFMASATKKEKEFSKKNTIVMSLTKERESWYGIIQHLNTVTSPQVWFTELAKADKGGIQIKGWSTTYPLVAEFMKTMENDKLFTEPVLISVEKDATTSTTKFDIVVKPRGI